MFDAYAYNAFLCTKSGEKYFKLFPDRINDVKFGVAYPSVDITDFLLLSLAINCKLSIAR